jgi:hypothetical protein
MPLRPRGSCACYAPWTILMYTYDDPTNLCGERSYGLVDLETRQAQQSNGMGF